MSFASLSSPGLNHNYSLYAIPAGWVVSMAPLWWAIGAAESAKKGTYDNANPQQAWKKLDTAPIEATLKRRIARAVAANNNNHTNLALFAGCLAAANAAHVRSRVLHICSATFLGSRVAYNLAYILIEDSTASLLRSGLFWVGVSSCLTLAVQAAEQYRKLPW